MFKREAIISSGSGASDIANTALRSTTSNSHSCWYSSIMTLPSSIWVLLGLGLTGVLLYARSRLRQTKKDMRAFIKQLQLLPPPQPASPACPHPLLGLTFAVQDIFDVEGFVTGFGCPDWGRTHKAASCTAPSVAALVQAGATCIGKTYMDEMGYGMTGQNKHYRTPANPAAISHVPGGPASGSAVAVAAKLVDFALGTDSGGGVRIPAAYCGILSFRSSHGIVSCSGTIPVSQSLDTVGWFARDPNILQKVGQVLLRTPISEVKQPRRVYVAEDLFNLISLSDIRIRQLSVVTSTFEKEYGGV